MRMNISQALPVIFTTTALTLSSGAFADHADSRFEGAAYDAWITGKVETVLTLNRELNPFEIDTDVEHSRVFLSGQVESDIDKALAEELALGINGVTEVENNLEVTEEADFLERSREQISQASSNLMNWVDDATTSASIKTRLLANSETEGLEIKVTTEEKVVRLEGAVKSAAERQLAEEIARNTDDVENVVNELMIVSNQ